MNLLAHLDVANHCVSREVNHRDVVTLAVADVELGDPFPGRVASAGSHNEQERDRQRWGFLPQPRLRSRIDLECIFPSTASWPSILISKRGLDVLSRTADSLRDGARVRPRLFPGDL